MFPTFDPYDHLRKRYRNRIDILKRIGKDIFPGAYLDRSIYDVLPSGQIVRKLPKRPGRYALRKNTKRARKLAAAAEV